MPKFRKRPVVIEARQWTGSNNNEDVISMFKFLCSGAKLPGDIGVTPNTNELHIPTREGLMTASMSDWIIKGVKGEFYPCKPDIFEVTYEPVDEEKG